MAQLKISSTIQMKSGYQIPRLGFGVYQTPARDVESLVNYAFQTGYRHVDSAAAYRNESGCGKAILSSRIPRSELFFTSKVPPRSLGYESTKKYVDSTLTESGLEYVDLYLIHAPYGGKEARLGAWKALTEAQREGKIRSLGVSNYGVHHLEELATYIKDIDVKEGQGKGGVISVGQWEVHPWCRRPDIVEWCQKHGVVVEAFCPLVRMKRSEEPALVALAQKYHRSTGQILLRWSLQKGYVPLPKSVTPSRIKENSELYDFELLEADLEALGSDEYSPCAWDPTISFD